MRIIAGEKRGTLILAPKGNNTRPTLDRIKESLFGILQFEIRDKCILDLFAGSGGIGLEAVSRGAAFAVFCDADKDAADIVKKNIAKLGFSSRTMFYAADYTSAIKKAASDGRKFDIVFLDPPYKSGYYENAIDMLFENGVLNDGFLIVAEHGEKCAIECHEQMMLCDERHYGETVLSFYRQK